MVQSSIWSHESHSETEEMAEVYELGHLAANLKVGDIAGSPLLTLYPTLVLDSKH